jgi:hypothetical protein
MTTIAELTTLTVDELAQMVLEQQKENIELANRLTAANRLRDDAEKKATIEHQRADDTADEAAKLVLHNQTLEDKLKASAAEVALLRKDLEQTKKERDDTGAFCMHLERELNDLKDTHAKCKHGDGVAKMEQAVAAACNIMGIPLDDKAIDGLIARKTLKDAMLKEPSATWSQRFTGKPKIDSIRQGMIGYTKDEVISVITALPRSVMNL